MTLGPRSIERPADAGYTLVSGLEGIAPAMVDGGGAVTPFGTEYSIDWWIGADDRWHLPAREPAVRQRRVGHGPIIETSLRVPSGDVIHTVYPVVVPGGMATVIEIANESPVPVALAIAVRPYGVNGDGGDRRFELGGENEQVLVDGQPALQLPRRPNEAGGSTTGDLLQAVSDGETLRWDGPVTGPLANGVCLYPLPHGTSLRFAIPGPGVTDLSLDGMPDAAAAARGWSVVIDRASSYQFPDSGVTDLANAARARLLMASPSLVDAVVDASPGAGRVLLGLAAGGHRLECRRVADAAARSFPTSIPSPAEGADLVMGLSATAELLGDPDLTDQLLDSVSQLTHLVEKAAKKHRQDPSQLAAVGRAKLGLATMADLTGQSDAAADLRRDATVTATPDLAQITEWAEQAAPARRWPGTQTAAEASAGPDDLTAGPDSAADAADFWLGARALLIRPAASAAISPGPAGPDHRPVVELLPEFPAAWRGGTVEIHRAPVHGALISFAIRWHGYRPALLWEVEGDVAVELRCPGLDPEWSTTDIKGEALLAGAAEELPDAPMPGDSFN